MSDRRRALLPVLQRAGESRCGEQGLQEEEEGGLTIPSKERLPSAGREGTWLRELPS